MFETRAAKTAVASLLVFVVALLLTLELQQSLIQADRRVGVVLDQSAEGILLFRVEKGLPAARGGLEVGDLLVSIDAVPITKLSDYDVAAGGFERGEPAQFVVRRDGREVRARVVPGAPWPWGAHLLTGLALLCYMGLGLLAWFQRPNDLRARLLFLFSAAVSIELALPYDAIGSPLLIVLALGSYYLLTGLQIGVELHLASVIPRRQAWFDRRPWLLALYYGGGLGLGLVAAATFTLEGHLGWDLFPWTERQSESVLVDWGLPLWALAVLAILAVQWRGSRRIRERNQALLILLGVLPWVLVVLVSSLFAWRRIEASETLASLESLALLAYPLAAFAAIYRYRLFDLELVVKRSVIYAVLTGSLILVFYAALGAGGLLFSELLQGGAPSVWLISAATLVLGLLFAPLRRFLQRLIDRRLFPERYALRQRLIALAGELPGLGKLPLMGEHLVTRLKKIFVVRAVTLLIADPESGRLSILASTQGRQLGAPAELLIPADDPGVQALQRAGKPLTAKALGVVSGRQPGASEGTRLKLRKGSLAVPLKLQGDLIGVLVLGPKESVDRFPAEEIELVNLLSHNVATVFQNARLFESATYESLTGLRRREAILEVLAREKERAVRYGRPLAVGMADLDHFKEVNDRHGHLAGDSLLKRVSQVVTSALRSTDAVGRYGGEEFLLVLPETDLPGARAVADKVRRLVEDTEIEIGDGSTVTATISIGLACLGPSGLPPESTVNDLLEAADRSLYQAKDRGRNRVFPPGIARVV